MVWYVQSQVKLYTLHGRLQAVEYWPASSVMCHTAIICLLAQPVSHVTHCHPLHGVINENLKKADTSSKRRSGYISGTISTSLGDFVFLFLKIFKTQTVRARDLKVGHNLHHLYTCTPVHLYSVTSDMSLF